MVSAKVWSRDSNRKIVYSDWKTFPTFTMDQLKLNLNNQDALDEYGGFVNMSTKATGFFRTEKINNKWWVIDPIGHTFIVAAVNSIKLGASPNNKIAFDSLYHTNQNWIFEVNQLLKSNGFNTAGSWSDVDEIRTMNKVKGTHLAYTTQLNLLNDFSKSMDRQALKNEEGSVLSYIFHPDFPLFVAQKCKLLEAYKNDPNLLGHFSDNELPFQENLIKKFAVDKDPNNPAFSFLMKWVNENNIDTAQITNVQKEQFSALVAKVYFSIVAAGIKKYDPNHLYIGSRIHAAVKDNIYFLIEMDQYVDIASINYYGNWNITEKHKRLFNTYLTKPFFITEYYTKGEDSKMGNISGAGWLVKTQKDRGNHYQNFCLHLLSLNNCVGWHWFKYQDNDPEDKLADPSNNDSNKGMVNTKYVVYKELTNKMKQLNDHIFSIIEYYKNK
jgi:hypothetical protein